MKTIINKIISAVSLVTMLLVSFMISVGASSLTSAYPRITNHEINGRIMSFSNYTRAAYLCEINPVEGEDFRLKWSDEFYRYIIYIKQLDGDPVPGSNSESGTLLDNVITTNNYVVIPNVDKYENSYIKISIQGVTKDDTYSGVTNYYLPIGKADHSVSEENDDFTFDDNRYIELGITSNGTTYGFINEPVPSTEKFRIYWKSSYQYFQLFVKQLSDEPNPNSDNEPGKLIYQVDARKNTRHTIAKSDMPALENSWIKLAIRGYNSKNDSSEWYYLYVYVSNNSSMPEFNFADSESSSVVFAEYTGFDYTTALKNLLNSGAISRTEYDNRLAVLKTAQEMVTVEWEAPVSFYTWKSSSQVYNNNAAMVSDRTKKTPNRYDKFVKGVTYTGIPYAANSSFNQYTVEEWIELINDENISASLLQGSVTYLGINRTNCTTKGIDCSGFVYRSMQSMQNYECGYLTTSNLLVSKDYTTVTTPKAGDILVKSGHTMIYLGEQDGRICVFESVADGTRGYSGCRYFEYTPAEIKGYIYRRCNSIND